MPRVLLVSPFKGGEHLEHPAFGVYQVLKVRPSGKDQEVAVRFDEVGVKRLVVGVARLDRVVTPKFAG